MNLEEVYVKSKVDHVLMINKDAAVIDFFPKNNYTENLNVNLSKGSKFFIEMGDDFFRNVLNRDELETVSLKSNNLFVLFVKKGEDILSFFSIKEIDTKLIELILKKYK